MQRKIETTFTKKNQSEVPDNTRKVMMRKYGLDEGTAYTETNTLLEPNNFIPSWEDGGEENREVSTALRRLREDYDEIRRNALNKDAELEQIRADIKKARQEEKRVSKDFGGANIDTELSQKELEHLKKTHDFQKMENMMYHYMCRRMLRDLISLSLTINDLTESLRSKKGISDEEIAKQEKSREQKLQSRFRLDNLMKTLERDQKKRQERITSLNLSIKNKEEAIQKRNDRKLNQNLIREKAQNESKDQKEEKMKEEFYVQKIWSVFYKKRMKREMEAHAQNEQAFMKMRVCAGNSDVKEMVNKFLTREQTFTSVLQSVSNLEEKYDSLKTFNADKREKLHQLQIENDNKKEVGFVDPRSADRALACTLKEHIDDNQAEIEYKRLSEELDQLRSHLEMLKQRKKNIQIINDQVGGWSTRVSKKLADQLDDHSLVNKNASLLQQFKNIGTLVHQQLNSIMDQRTQNEAAENSDEAESINIKDLQNDFATDEFISKNVRVRPTSSYSIGKGGREESEHAQKSGLGGPASIGDDEDERKFNADQLLELNYIREQQKERKRKEQELKVLEMEKAEKKKKKQ